MEVKKLITITLSGEEAWAVKSLLGTFDRAHKRELGLSEKLCDMTSELYDKLSYYNVK